MAKAVAVKSPVLRRSTKRVLAALHASNIAQHTTALIRDSPPLRVLGLDINTNSTGFAVLNEHGRVSTWGHIPTAHIQSSDVLGIAHAIDTALSDVHCRVLAASNDEEAPEKLQWHVGIEDFMRMYRFGRFHNKGIFQLAQLNGIVSYTCWQRFRGATPIHTHPSAARAFFNITASKKSKPKGSETDIKEQVMNFVQQQEPQSFPTTNAAASAADDANGSGIFAKTRNGRFSEAAFDVADAYVIAAFTRWKHFQEKLLLDPRLADEFGDVYMQMTMQHADGKKSAKLSVEERALLDMSAVAKQLYLRALYVHGVEEWIKTSHLDLFAKACSSP